MPRRQRLRRVAILCYSFARNLAYYRVGQEDCSQPLTDPCHPHSSFWRQVNSNFLDLCVLEWCKLFADKNGEHYWRRVVSDKEAFEGALWGRTGVDSKGFKDQIEAMRRYRDRFVAHLDSDLVMQIPMLDVAQKSVWFYHAYLVEYEVAFTDLDGVAYVPNNMTLGYNQCAEEARAIARHALRHDLSTASIKRH